MTARPARVVDPLKGDGAVELAVGDDAVLELPENPTTGYRWAFEISDSAIASVDGSQFRPRSSQMGSGGDRLFKITALAPGSTEITLKRWRAWEGEGSVERRFALQVQVRHSS